MTNATAGAAQRGTAARAGTANGPEDLDWEAVDWRSAEDRVRRLRQRIFKASQAGDLAKVRNLQKLMLRGHANTLVSVRQVTQRNAGRKTAGVDGEVALTSAARAGLVAEVHHVPQSWQALPVKRVYIAKSDGKQRPLGIPVIFDRVQQARVKNALEPEWEARFEPRSYGFRPGRSCQDAIEAIFTTACGKSAKRLWALDADLAAAFDRIDHDHLLSQLGTFPARAAVRRWLKAGVVETGRFTPTEEGTPQGGVISPLLLNVALHGMEKAAGARCYTVGDHGVTAVPDAPVLVRYADDLIVLCHSRERAEQVQHRLAEWLAPRGLVFNEDKTRITRLDDGVDFLGFSARRHDQKLLVKPSTAAVRRIRRRLATEMRSLRGANAATVVARLNPIIRGWSAFYRSVVSSRVFNALDAYLWKLTYRWAIRSHRNKPKRWVVSRYYGQFRRSRNDRWVFGDRVSGAYLLKFSWTPIVRHALVRGTASPDDPALARYWDDRRRRTPPPHLDKPTQRLWQVQRGRCPVCRGGLLPAGEQPQTPQEWELWLAASRTALRTQRTVVQENATRSDGPGSHRLIHAQCRRRSSDRHGPNPAQLRQDTPMGPA